MTLGSLIPWLLSPPLLTVTTRYIAIENAATRVILIAGITVSLIGLLGKATRIRAWALVLAGIVCLLVILFVFYLTCCFSGPSFGPGILVTGIAGVCACIAGASVERTARNLDRSAA
jgi:hypothetical protein